MSNQNKKVKVTDLDHAAYQPAWDFQEKLLKEIVDLKIDYGDTIAVDGISFQVEAGEIYGLIGPNGAGKTTTIKAIANLLEPTYGEISIGGASAIHEPEKTRGMIGPTLPRARMGNCCLAGCWPMRISQPAPKKKTPRHPI